MVNRKRGQDRERGGEEEGVDEGWVHRLLVATARADRAEGGRMRVAEVILPEGFKDSLEFFGMLKQPDNENADKLLRDLIEKRPDLLNDLDLIDLFFSGFLRGQSALEMIEFMEQTLPGHPLTAFCTSHRSILVDQRSGYPELNTSIPGGCVDKRKQKRLLRYTDSPAKRYSHLSGYIHEEAKAKGDPVKLRVANLWAELSIALDPTVARRQLRLIRHYLELEDYKRAARVLKPEIELDDSTIEKLVELFVSLTGQAVSVRDDAEVPLIELLISILEPLARIEGSAGEYFAELRGNLTQMIEASELNPETINRNSAQSLALFAKHLISQEGELEALPYAQRAVELDSSNPFCLITLSRCHRLLGNFDEALVAAERAVELSPENINDAYLELGEVFFNLEQYQDSTQAFKEALEINRGDFEILCLSRSFLREGKMKEALNLLREVPEERQTDNHKVILCLALLVAEDDEMKEEAIGLAKGILRRSKNIHILTAVSICMFLLDLNSEALDAITKAMQIKPENKNLNKLYEKIKSSQLNGREAIKMILN